MGKYLRVTFSVALFALASLNRVAMAQNTNSGYIRGTATDASGALIPDVNVTVTNLDTGVVKHLTTNSDGLYDTSSIVVGRYSIKFEKTTFSTFERSSVTIKVGTSTIDAVMRVGSVAQEIVVNTDMHC